MSTKFDDAKCKEQINYEIMIKIKNRRPPYPSCHSHHVDVITFLLLIGEMD